MTIENQNRSSVLVITSNQPLFEYDVTPPQVDTSTGTDNPITLTVGVYNPKENGSVACPTIKFAISIGDTQESDLTNDASDVQSNSNQTTWQIEKLPYTESPLIFQATPATGTTGLDPGESISFQLTGINVNGVEGDAPVSVEEGTSTPPPLLEILVNKVSPSLQIPSFQATPANIDPDQPATLSWETVGANACDIDQLQSTSCQSPPEPLPLTGQINVCPKQTTTYTLTAYDSGNGYRERQTTVTVMTASIVSMEATPETLDSSTTSSTITWEVENATKLTLAWPGSGMNVTGTSQPVTPEITLRDTTSVPYTLTAINENNQSSDSRTLNIYVNQATITAFTAIPATFVRGQPVTLQWDTQWAATCEIDEGIGPIEPASGGSIEVQPEATIKYTLTALGLGVADTLSAATTAIPSGWGPTTNPPVNANQILSYKGNLWAFDLSTSQSVYSSADGINWTQVADSLPLSSRVYSAAAVFDDGSGEKMWIMGGLGLDGSVWNALNDIWSSPDGITWTQVAANDVWSGRLGLACVVFDKKIWVLGGFGIPSFSEPYNWEPKTDTVWSSSDGANWVQTTNVPWSARGFAGAAVFDPTQPSGINQLWICGGSAGGDTAPPCLDDAWYTSDGTTWTQAVTPAWPGRGGPILAMLNNQLWLFGGFPTTADFSQYLTDIWTMDADLTWTKSSTVVPAVFSYGVTLPVATTLNYTLWLAGPSAGVSTIQYFNP